MNKPFVVLDTNVLVAGLRSRRGASHQILLGLSKNWYVPCVSVPLFLEYEDVLKRPGMIPGLKVNDIDDILNFLLSRANLRQIFFLWRPHLKDPKDDLVLEVAVESGAKSIITHNTGDFANVDQFGIDICTPQQFLRSLEDFL